MTRTFIPGRLEQFDEESKRYTIARHPAVKAAPLPTTKRWDVPPPAPLDQGDTPECVAYAGAHELIAAPVETPGITGATAQHFYAECKRIDGLGRRTPGTSVLAIAKVLRAHGYITGYSWAFSEPQLAAAVSALCPVIIGVGWRADMMDPDSNNVIHASGQFVDGHAPLVIGIDVETGMYDILCAWQDWGINSVVQVSRADMALLLFAQGEAMVPVQVDPAPPLTPTPLPPTPGKA